MKELMVYLNGKMVPESQASLPLSDSGFLWGDTVYECARTFNFKPFKLREHIQRLYRSLKMTRIDLAMGPEELETVSLELLEVNRELFGGGEDVWINHDVTRGRYAWERWVRPEARDRYPATVIIQTPALEFTVFAKYYRSGVHIITPSVRQMPHICIDPKIKHRSRLHFFLAELEVKEVDMEGFSLLLDLEGSLTENKGGNFFLVTDGVLRTPPPQNILCGVSRATVLDLARELGIPAVEESLHPYDAYNAQEAFLTSTPYCILPVSRFNGLPIGEEVPGPLTRKLLKAWQELVELDFVQQALDHLPR